MFFNVIKNRMYSLLFLEIHGQSKLPSVVMSLLAYLLTIITTVSEHKIQTDTAAKRIQNVGET